MEGLSIPLAFQSDPSPGKFARQPAGGIPMCSSSGRAERDRLKAGWPRYIVITKTKTDVAHIRPFALAAGMCGPAASLSVAAAIFYSRPQADGSGSPRRATHI
jgi:hypothetical protein